MNEYIPFRKGSLLIPTGGCFHLHVICNDPVFYPRQGKDCFLGVNISSISPLLQHDTSCILKPGDHPFIKHDSFILYSEANIFGAITTAQHVAEGDWIVRDPFEDRIFDTILSGFLTSREVRPKIQQFVKLYCL